MLFLAKFFEIFENFKYVFDWCKKGWHKLAQNHSSKKLYKFLNGTQIQVSSGHVCFEAYFQFYENIT
jgi:hypothetical protein